MSGQRSRLVLRHRPRRRPPPARPPWSLEIHGAIAPLAVEWDALADRTAAPPFLRPGWFEAWWEAFGRGALEILALRRDGALAAVLPLARRFGVLRSLSNWHTPEFGALGDPASQRALADALLASDARQIALAFVDPRAQLVRNCVETTRRQSLVHMLERSPYLRLEERWEDYEQRQLSTRRRAEIRRRLRQLMDVGPLSVEVSDGTGPLEDRLAEGLAVEAASWKGDAGTAIASNPDTLSFYTAIARWAASRGELRLAFLRVGDRAVAFDLALEAGGAHYLLKGGHDPTYRRFGPGIALRRDMVARAFAHGLHTYEFLGQDTQTKRDWTDRRHDRVRLQLFARRASGRLDHATWTHVAPLARRAVTIARRSPNTYGARA